MPTSKIWDVEIAHHKRRIEGGYPQPSTRWCHDPRDIPCGKGGGDKDDKKEEEDKKKKSIAFKASSSSSKNKGKSKKESSDDDDLSDIDDEAMALFVRKMGKFMKKKGYGARKRRDHTKSKEYVRRCYNCKSPDHVVANCPYNSDNDEDEKKKHKNDKIEKKEKKEKRMTFQKKKKGGGYVVTWDSDGFSDSANSSDNGKKSIKKD